MLYNTQNYWVFDFFHRPVFYLFYPSSTHVRASSQFLLHIFLLLPAELAWSQVIK
jgi:hypothetical protein